MCMSTIYFQESTKKNCTSATCLLVSYSLLIHMCIYYKFQGHTYSTQQGEGGEGVVASTRKIEQGIFTMIINDNNLKQKALVCFVSLKVLEVTFFVGVKTKCPTIETLSVHGKHKKVYGVCSQPPLSTFILLV